MKRVLVISNMYPSKRSKTYGIFVKNQVEQLRAKGLQVDTATIKDPRRGKFRTIRKHLLWFLKILSILIFKGRKYDIVHAHYIFPSGWPALLFQKFYKTKIIVTSHGGDIDQMAHKSNFTFKQTRLILERADQIIVVGKQLKRDILSDFHIPRGKITVLNMGVDRKIFKPLNKENSRQELRLKDEKHHILFVGNIIKAKGLIDLLDALKILQAKHRNLQLHIIGPLVDKEFKHYLEGKIQGDHISGVRFYGPVDQSDLALWMTAANLFVLPSHIEGFGLVALEAMSSHTPVVATRVGGLKYLLKDGAGILVEKENPQSLAKGMEEALFNDSKIELLIQRGEKRAKIYDQKEILEKLIDIYNETTKE